MKREFVKGEKAQVFNLKELRKLAEHWGKRDIKEVPISYNSTWQIAWYKPKAWTLPHWHEGCESVYYFHFLGEGGKVRAYLGWPISKARVMEITEPTLMYIPAFEAHYWENIGNVDMVLVHAFSPPWKEVSVGDADVTDAESGEKYTNVNAYADHVREADEKFVTFSGYIEHLKQKGLY